MLARMAKLSNRKIYQRSCLWVCLKKKFKYKSTNVSLNSANPEFNKSQCNFYRHENVLIILVSVL